MKRVIKLSLIAVGLHAYTVANVFSEPLFMFPRSAAKIGSQLAQKRKRVAEKLHQARGGNPYLRRLAQKNRVRRTSSTTKESWNSRL